MERGEVRATRLASAVLYVGLAVAAFVEQWGKTTSDTKTALIERPATFLSSTFSLWNPDVSLGELQNQAYGYLFPQGSFYLLAELADVPPWVGERIWSLLLLVAGCEGARLLARVMGLGPWPAWVAGVAYGLSPRLISEIGVRSAEILPGVTLPWVVLPLVLAANGRIGPRSGALLSVAAFMFAGAVNGTATAAILPVPAILLVWAIRQGRLRWSVLALWSGLLVVANAWWAASLLKLNAYSPPFFDYVEDARATTMTTGWFPSLRGASNWVSYLSVGGTPNWPAGWEHSYTPVLVAASGVLAAIGLVGLSRFHSPWRGPLALSAAFGLVCLTIGHAWALESPLAMPVQELLDGPLALLRNVHKIDPVLRLPLAIGAGAALQHLWQRRPGSVTGSIADSLPDSSHRWLRPASLAVVSLLAIGMAQPAFAMNLRTPGWDRVPEYWQQTADFLEDQSGNNRAWLIPGAGFAVKTWGWTLDEPFAAVASTPWVTRSQVPLAPPETITILSRLEDLLDTGSGSPALGSMLARMGLGYVVVAHDLDPDSGEATRSSVVSIALARSGGLRRVATFGAGELGPAIEVFKVSERPAPDIAVRPRDATVTVAGASPDVVDAVGRGMIELEQPVVVQGDNGWDEPATVVGDAHRLRERNFGRVHDSLGPTLARDEPLHGGRRVPNYPANPGAKPVYAKYTGISYVNASTSQGFTDVVGPTRPEQGPFAAVDGDPTTEWRSRSFTKPVGEWLELRLREPRPIHTVRISSPQFQPAVNEVRAWRVSAGGRSVRVSVDPHRQTATAFLRGVRADRVRVTAVRVADPDREKPVAISELTIPGLEIDRTLVVPYQDLTADSTAYMFSGRPETRACITTLLGPDCQADRARLSDEPVGLDRTFYLPGGGSFDLTGTVIARSRPTTSALLDPWGGPLVVRATSTWYDEPTVAPRMAYDAAVNTSWIASAADPAPTLVMDWEKPVTIRRVAVAAPAPPAVRPTRATLRSDAGVRDVDLTEFGYIEPLRTRHLEITFRNPTRQGAPLGVSEIELRPGKVGLPLDGAQTTGAVCGSGPTVTVNGQERKTRVDGVMGNVVSAGPLELSLCGRPLELPAGWNRIRVGATEQFHPVNADLLPSAPAETATAPARSLVVRSSSADHQVLDLGAGEASLLTTTRNLNRGWVATLDGKRLPVQRIDGWAQGWRLPSGEGGRLVIDYQPQRSFVVALVVGLVLAGLVLLAGVVALVRVLSARPRVRLADDTGSDHRPAQPVHAAHRSRRRPRVVAVAVLAIGVGYLLGGAPAAVGVLLAAVLRQRQSTIRVLGALMLVAASAWAALELVGGPRMTSGGVNALAGVAAAMVLAAVAWDRPQVARR